MHLHFFPQTSIQRVFFSSVRYNKKEPNRQIFYDLNTRLIGSISVISFVSLQCLQYPGKRINMVSFLTIIIRSPQSGHGYQYCLFSSIGFHLYNHCIHFFYFLQHLFIYVFSHIKNSHQLYTGGTSFSSNYLPIVFLSKIFHTLWNRTTCCSG